MKVKTLREHGNRFGEGYEKAKGVIYELPDEDAAALIRDKLVEKTGDTDSAPKAAKAAE